MEMFYDKGTSIEERVEEAVPKHIKFVDKRNQRQIDRFYEREIVLMRHLREARHEVSPFRRMIVD
ncbi:MAG: hypothetical protein ACFFG0_42200 [Candidatus Thorarchaeota archaeon]